MSVISAEAAIMDWHRLWSGGARLTNHFGSVEALLLSAAPPVAYVAFETVVLILIPKGRVMRLHYLATDLDSLRQALLAWRAVAPAGVSVELVGTQGGIAAVEAVFVAVGFTAHVALLRMFRPAAPMRPGSAGGYEIGLAGPSDIAFIASLLDEAFDAIAEPAPLHDELFGAIQAGAVLVARQSASVVALLWADRKNLVAHVRYWWVAESCRGQGLGAGLFRSLLADSPRLALRLWVREDNANARVRYESLGFTADGMFDKVMCLGC